MSQSFALAHIVNAAHVAGSKHFLLAKHRDPFLFCMSTETLAILRQLWFPFFICGRGGRVIKAVGECVCGTHGKYLPGVCRAAERLANCVCYHCVCMAGLGHTTAE